MSFYAVCYGHACRYEQANSIEEAARLAFGVKFDVRMTVEKLPKSPKSMSHKAKMAFLKPLALRHFKNTSNVLEGWSKEIAVEFPDCVGYVLQDMTATDTGFAVDSPIEGPIFTRILNHADVFQSVGDADSYGKQNGYKLVKVVKVLLDPKRERATAVAFVK